MNNTQEEEYFIQTHSPDDYIFQSFIEADEYTVDAYVSANDGKVLGIVPRKRLEIFNGEVTKSITIKDDEIIYWADKILRTAPFCGPITIQFLRERLSNKLYIMEINPRAGGGIINSIEAGFDVPSIILKEYLKMPLNPITHWRDNLMMVRTFKEIFICKS